MKRTMALIGCLILLVMTQSSTTDGHIDQIREWYKEIEAKVKTCQLVETEGEYFEGTTPEVKGWYEKETEQFIKIECYMGADHHEETVSYYLNNGIVFFTFTEGTGVDEFHTAEDMGMGEDEYWESGMEAKTYDSWEDRLYFHDEKCIRSLHRSNIYKVGDALSFKGVDNENAEIDPDAYIIATEHAGWYLDYLKKKMAE
ncbi:hypothetical protein JYT25_00185 [bacterium AH-315-C20]|nr:hypothetical protein [bacterium AH-315-C20]